MARIICGVDVSKAFLDARIRTSDEEARFSNDAEGIAALLAWCLAGGVELVAMEATGGYERLTFVLLSKAGLGVVVVNPARVRQFAKSQGRLEKTDRIDAGVIAHFAEVSCLVAMPLPSQDQTLLTQYTRRLGQVTGFLTSERQRLGHAEDEVQSLIVESVAFLRAQARQLEARIMELVAESPVWSTIDRALREVKGVANRTIAWLLADLPELGHLTSKQISEIAGLCPIPRESGKRKGGAHIAGGRASVRSILFVVAEIVRRYDPTLNAFAQRLKAAGKPPKVIRVAIAHKLLVRLNAKARDARKTIAPAT